jgi:tRNA-modifying protein YgfZ
MISSNSSLQGLRQVQANMGASFDRPEDRPLSFGNDREALTTAMTGVAAIDRTHWGILKFTGDDRIRYLHNQSTNDFQILKAGEGCQTVFVTSTARTIDLATAYVNTDDVLVIASPNRHQYLYEWLDRFLFPMDKVQISDISGQYAIFDLIGDRSAALLQKLGLESLIGQPQHRHQVFQIDDIAVTVAIGNSLTKDGATFIVKVEDSAAIWSKLVELRAIPLGDRVWEQIRILQGRPIPFRELTDDYNPLEAGLCQAVSINKGCYIGQETIARLNTYQGVKQRLWGVKLAEFAPIDTDIAIEGNKVGKLTSCTETTEGIFGLAYIKTKAGGAGLSVTIGDTTGEIISVPFLVRDLS